MASQPSRVDCLAEHLRYWRDVQQMDTPEADEIARIAVKFLNAEDYPKPSPYARCTMCGAPLDVPGRPWSRNCGGDCIACMAESDDPECEESVAAMRAGEAVVRAAGAVTSPIDRNLGGYSRIISDTAYVALRDALPPGKGEEE